MTKSTAKRVLIEQDYVSPNDASDILSRNGSQGLLNSAEALSHSKSKESDIVPSVQREGRRR